jgi:hypothetical protein
MDHGLSLVMKKGAVSWTFPRNEKRDSVMGFSL